MQLSLFDTLNMYKDWVIDNQDVTWKPSKKLHYADVLYYKKTPMFHISIYKSDVHDAWHFHTQSMTLLSGTGYLTYEPTRDLNKTIQMWIEKYGRDTK